MTRHVIDVPGLHHGGQPIPVAVEKDGVLITGGVSGRDPATGSLPEELTEEIAQLYRNIEAILAAAGFDLDDVIKVAIFVADRDTRTLINDGWLALFPNENSRPARHTIVQNIPPGLRVQAEIMAVRSSAVSTVRPGALSAATVYEASGQRASLPSAIKPIGRNVRLQGPAFTVSCAPRDNLALHHAIARAPRGSVLVCHTGGHYDAGYFGDVMATAAVARGIAGLVIDACVRDAADLRESELAVFSRGLSIRGTTKDPALPSMIGCRLRIGEVDIDPGDLVVADDDGVAIVERAREDEDRQASQMREETEAAIRSRLIAGDLTTEIYHLPPLRGLE